MIWYLLVESFPKVYEQRPTSPQPLLDEARPPTNDSTGTTKPRGKSTSSACYRLEPHFSERVAGRQACRLSSPVPRTMFLLPLVLLLLLLLFLTKESNPDCFYMHIYTWYPGMIYTRHIFIPGYLEYFF